MEKFSGILFVSLLYLYTAISGAGGVLTDQEEISQSFFNKLNQATSEPRKSGAGPANYGPRRPLGGLNHLYTWQNMFHAANDAFKIFKKFDKVNKPERAEQTSPLKKRKIQNNFEIKDFFNGRSQEDLINEENKPDVSLFKSFEAVPQINRETGKEIKTTLTQILGTTTTTATTPGPEREVSSNPLIDFIYSLDCNEISVRGTKSTTYLKWWKHLISNLKSLNSFITCFL